MPRAIVCWIVGLSMLALSRGLAAADEDATSEAMLADAQLTDVTFADGHGWAVGDRGVIWHTSDAGKHWTLQDSGVDCRLASVCFLDAKTGWAAGGYTQPYTHVATGVILHTRDGGARWTVDRKLVLPAIERIRFFDAKNGWALGQSSAYFPSGVYSTSDGGRTWAALPAAIGRSWLAGDMIDPNTGALAGHASALATIRRRGIEPQSADFGLRGLRRMKLLAPAHGWLVGDGGLVLQTQDLGKSWQTTAGDMPSAVRDLFDFAALEVRGQHCWIAGTPGTRVLHSADAGQTWTVGQTGQTLPIGALAFSDDQNGWAVGDLGLILNTTDGGKTWRKARASAERSAYVGFYGRGREVPLELVARLSADEGYLGVMEVLNRDDVASLAMGAADAVSRAHEAHVRAGGSVARGGWRFPLRSADLKLSAEQLVEGWNQVNDGQSVEKLEAHVVARIRMWRPSVVFTSASETGAGDPLAHLVNQLVLRAVSRAAEPAHNPEQIEAGLPPWKVQKVYGSLAAGETGNANVNTGQLAARLGQSIGELATAARAILPGDGTVAAANLGFRLLVDEIPQEVGQRDFFSGIALAPGGEARRAVVHLPENNLAAMRREAQARRNLQAILAQAEQAGDGRWLANIAEQTKSFDPRRGADVVSQLAQRYHRTGQWELAAECQDLIVDRYKDQPLAAGSLVWLVQYYASAEAAWRNRAAGQITVQQAATVEKPEGQPNDQKLTGALSNLPGKVQQARALESVAQPARGLLNDERGSNERLARASGYAKQLEQFQPALYGEPEVRFPLAVAQRQQGLSRQAERFYHALRHSRPHDAWWASAQAELWLLEPKGQPPKEMLDCTRAVGKPRLDGTLDEPTWRSAATLRSPQRDDGDWGAVAMLAYDEEFLYVGVSCQKAAGFAYRSSAEPRPRDADLANQDRIEILLDVDRDLATYYRLSIDHRGWTADSCWRDSTWNPNWFVASGATDEAWTVEAAIPLSELTGRPPQPNQVWAAGLQRIVPGVGFQSWTTPAASEIMPEGFGLLLFR